MCCEEILHTIGMPGNMIIITLPVYDSTYFYTFIIRCGQVKRHRMGAVPLSEDMSLVICVQQLPINISTKECN